MIRRYFVYGQALSMRRASRAGRMLRARDDIFHLRFEELQRSCERTVDERLIRERRAAYRSYRAMMPRGCSRPTARRSRARIDAITAGGGAGRAPVSAGTVEGRARVVLDIAEADPRPADILVTTFNGSELDAPLHRHRGLVTEVGEVMTHGR
jgi:pyruvate,water dikinase